MKLKTFCGVFAFTFPDGSTTPFNRGLLSVLGDFFELTFDEDFSHIRKVRKDFETAKKIGEKVTKRTQIGGKSKKSGYRPTKNGEDRPTLPKIVVSLLP